MQITKDFKLVELVGPEIYEYMGDHSAQLLNPSALKWVQAARDKFGPCVINDWSWGGRFKESGHRLWDTKTGAKASQHKFGNAFDLKFKSVDPDEVRHEILKNQEYWMNLGLTRIEANEYAPTWMHGDSKVTGLSYIQVIKP